MYTLKAKPLSVNKAWQGRRFKSKDYLEYEKELMFTLPSGIIVPQDLIRITYMFGVSMATDWDNPVKPFQDILQKKYMFDDKNILDARIIKIPVTKGKEFIKFKLDPLDHSYYDYIDNFNI